MSDKSYQSDINQLLKKGNYQEIKNYLLKLDSYDMAESIKELEPEDIKSILDLFDSEEIGDILSYLDEEIAADYLEALNTRNRLDIIDTMDDDDATDITKELELEYQQEVVEQSIHKDDIKELLKYDENEIGSKMTTMYISVEEDLDVKDATKKVTKEAPDVQNVSTIFVVDNDKIYKGAIKLIDLLRAKTPEKITSITSFYESCHSTDDTLESITKMTDLNLPLLPVLDEEEKLVGVVTPDDALIGYREETEKDLGNLVGITEVDEKSSFFKKIKSRFIPLVIVLVLAVPGIFITYMFDEVLAAVALLILFSPLILDISGDVSSQTLGVTLRALNTNDISLKKIVKKELLTGVCLAVILGIIGTVLTFVVMNLINKDAPHKVEIGIAVGSSMMLSIIISTSIGFAVPFVADKVFKLDPAIVSGPALTTIIDIVSLLSYLGLATILIL